MACAACHVNNNYTTLPTNCYGCHQADFTGTNNPPHVAAGFPTTCDTCHTTTNWTSATFNHNTTSFPLTGAHTTVACASCHTNNNYTTLPTACYGCHQADFTGTTNPAHVAGGFPTDCTLCHSTTTWTTSTFNHSTVFPLSGATPRWPARSATPTTTTPRADQLLRLPPGGLHRDHQSRATSPPASPQPATPATTTTDWT